MKNAKTSNRRNFLLAAGLGTAGAVAAVAGATRGKRVVGAASQEGKARGYHASEHVLKYYETTKV